MVADDGTILLEAEQVGHLNHFGHFTGHFSYVAVATPVSFVLLGDATLTNEQGEELFLSASIVELGADYPLTVWGPSPSRAAPAVTPAPPGQSRSTARTKKVLPTRFTSREYSSPRRGTEHTVSLMW